MPFSFVRLNMMKIIRVGLVYCTDYRQVSINRVTLRNNQARHIVSIDRFRTNHYLHCNPNDYFYVIINNKY
jgi:hypothetical protein